MRGGGDVPLQGRLLVTALCGVAHPQLHSQHNNMSTHEVVVERFLLLLSIMEAECRHMYRGEGSCPAQSACTAVWTSRSSRL